MPKPELVYELHSQRCEDTDFWGQVRRTVGGEPVPEEQIALIVAQMRRLLEVDPADRFLDLCCGNGALTDRVFRECASGTGVDVSPTLIRTARVHFPMGGRIEYVERDVLSWACEAAGPASYQRAMIYGSINFFDRGHVRELLSVLRERFTGLGRLAIGNVADLDRLGDFFRDGAYQEGIEEDPSSAIGVWWTREQMRVLADETGWVASFATMPPEFFASHYRFDVLLVPR